jgi:hypothetical protein
MYASTGESSSSQSVVSDIEEIMDDSKRFADDKKAMNQYWRKLEMVQLHTIVHKLCQNGQYH